MQIILDYIWSNFFINEILLGKNNKLSLKVSILFSFHKYNLFIFEKKKKILKYRLFRISLSSITKKYFQELYTKHGKIIIKKIKIFIWNVLYV